MSAYVNILMKTVVMMSFLLFPALVLGENIEATLPDSDNTSSFQIKNTDSGTNTVLMDVQSGGNVGIGTTAPKEKLQIGDTLTVHDGGWKIFSFNSYWNGSNDVRIANGYASAMAFTDTGEIIFRTAGTGSAGGILDEGAYPTWDTPPLKVTNDGKIGIGKAPNEKLDVNGNVKVSGTDGKLVFPASHYDTKIELYEAGEEKIGTAEHQLKLIAGDVSPANVAFFGGETEVMRVDTGSGKVGIGTTSPKATLDVNGSFAFGYSPVNLSSATTYNVADRDVLIGITSLPTSEPATIQLPVATTDNVGRIIIVKNETSGSEYVPTVVPSAGQMLDGSSAGMSLDSYDYLTLYSNGSGWFVISRKQAY